MGKMTMSELLEDIEEFLETPDNEDKSAMIAEIKKLLEKADKRDDASPVSPKDNIIITGVINKEDSNDIH